MAKKKAGGINKSELIRAFKAEHPEAKPKEIADALTTKHGVEFKPQVVSTTLSNAKKAAVKKPAKRGPKSKKGQADAAVVMANASATGDWDFIDAAEAFVKLVGGTMARKVLEMKIKELEG